MLFRVAYHSVVPSSIPHSLGGEYSGHTCEQLEVELLRPTVKQLQTFLVVHSLWMLINNGLKNAFELRLVFWLQSKSTLYFKFDRGIGVSIPAPVRQPNAFSAVVKTTASRRLIQVGNCKSFSRNPTKNWERGTCQEYTGIIHSILLIKLPQGKRLINLAFIRFGNG